MGLLNNLVFRKMDAFIQYQNDLYNKNKRDFADLGSINWMNQWAMEYHEQARKELLDAIGATLLFKETKPYHNHISKGCSICGAGQWSCLFITGVCNANCFYCPASQNTEELPQSQGLTFETPESYAEYINHFGFTGASFSGGEPLLVFDKVVAYLKAIRQMCSPDVYTWMYTNGILGSPAIFETLGREGLNEVRFDIGATRYKLDAVAMVQNSIPVVTIEIPAVPEKVELIKELLPQMEALGVQNLNLHQLRLTRYNAPKLLKHNYTYIPVERPIVAESELAALEIIKHVHQTGLKLGVNYCSFHYKNRFQKAGFRKIVAQKFIHPEEIITQNGYVRNRNAFSLNYETFSIYDELNPKAAVPTYSLELKHKKYLISRHLASRVVVNNIAPHSVSEVIDFEPSDVPTDEVLFKIWQFEHIEKGLR